MAITGYNVRLAHAFSLALLAATACSGRLVGEIDDPDAGNAASDARADRDAIADAAVDTGPTCTTTRGADTGCGISVTLSCPIDPPAGGYTEAFCASVCGPRDNDGGWRNWWGCGPAPQTWGGDKGPDAGSKISTIYCYTCVAGRRPEGFAGAPTDATVAGWLTQMAHLEEASISAFDDLGANLAAIGAPQWLLAAVTAARADEIRHTQTMTGLATKAGATPAGVELGERKAKCALDLAVENAVEGCVRETYGALVAEWQATHAGRHDVRDAMRGIATDERAHAALSWAVADWLNARLTPHDRAQVQTAMVHAIDQLALEAAFPMGPDCERELGLPTPREASAMVDSLRATFWLGAAA
jgi:hypothetical protein